MYECVGLLNQCTLLASSYALGVIKLLKCDTMLNFSSVNLHYMCICLSLYEKHKSVSNVLGLSLSLYDKHESVSNVLGLSLSLYDKHKSVSNVLGL